MSPALREPSTARLWVTFHRVLRLLLSVVARNALAAPDAGNVQVQGQRPLLVFACDSDTAKDEANDAAAARLSVPATEPRTSDSLC